jgi:hypothetical protein
VNMVMNLRVPLKVDIFITYQSDYLPLKKGSTLLISASLQETYLFGLESPNTCVKRYSFKNYNVSLIVGVVQFRVPKDILHVLFSRLCA